MFDEPNDDPDDEAAAAERAADPATRAKEKAEEFRMHAELAAVFEGIRKFDAGFYPNLDADRAREVQRTMGRLAKAKTPESPVLPEPALPDAAALLDYWRRHDLSTNDYHVHRRPGEVMIVRWLEADQ